MGAPLPRIETVSTRTNTVDPLEFLAPVVTRLLYQAIAPKGLDCRQPRSGRPQDLYGFLDVDPAFVPDFATPPNVGGMRASRLLEGLFTSSPIRLAVEPWLPKRAASWVRRLRTRNMRQAPPLPVELRKELTHHFRDDIAMTSQLIGRSLERWL